MKKSSTKHRYLMTGLAEQQATKLMRELKSSGKLPATTNGQIEEMLKRRGIFIPSEPLRNLRNRLHGPSTVRAKIDVKGLNLMLENMHLKERIAELEKTAPPKQ